MSKVDMQPKREMSALGDIYRRQQGVGRRVARDGSATLGWYRGQHEGWWDACKWLKRNGYAKASEALRRHYNLDRRGNLGTDEGEK